MSHPRDGRIGFEAPRKGGRSRNQGSRAFDEGGSAGGRGERYVDPNSPFVLPMRDAPTHLRHGMDCPRCLANGREGDDRGWVEVNLGLHVSEVVPPGVPPTIALGMTLSPRMTPAGPVTRCTRGCVLGDEEWELILCAAFLDACAGYVARVSPPPGPRKRNPRRRKTQLDEP